MAIFKDYKVHNGFENMAIDSELLDYAIDNNLKEPILRLYGWSPPCVSLGRNQSDTSVNRDYCQANNIDIVRRLTGGRALLHDKELTYSFICPTNLLKAQDSVILSYKEISGALILGFEKLGIELSFPENKKPNSKFDYCMSISSGADLSYQGKKLIGSAQFRKNNYLLQHGSILIAYDSDIIQKIFNEKICKESITSLIEINPDIEHELLINSIKQGFEEYFKSVFL